MNVLGNKYPIYINLYPKISIHNQSRVFLSISNNNFLFTGTTCLSSSGIDAFGTTITALDPSIYTCEIDTINNLVKLNINTDLIGNISKIQIMTYIVNPNRIYSNAYIKARLLYAYANHIVSEITLSAYGLSTSPLTISDSGLNLGWNLPYLTNMAPSKQLMIVRGNANPPTAYIYNSLRFWFKTSSNFPENLAFQLNINLKTSDTGLQSSYVLTGSIIENLPGFAGGQVSCYILNNDQLTSTIRQLICDNIGSLTASTYYYISLRMFFQYDVSLSNLPTDFSKITIFSKTSTNLDPNPIIATTLITSNAIKTVNNDNWYITALKNTVVTSQIASISSLLAPEVSGGVLGLQYLFNKDPQRLIFNLNIPASKSTATAFSGISDTSITNSAGLYIVMNPIISIDANPTLENTAGITTNTAVTVQRNISNSNINNPDNKIIIQVSGSTTWTLQHLYANSNSNRFSLKNAVINSPSGYYGADDALMDFYFYTYDQITTANPTSLGFFMANAYTITTPKPNYLYFGMVNWYGGSTVYNDGNYLPTFIRVYGFIRNSDIDPSKTSKRLAIFFDGGLSFYPNSTDPTDKTIACSSSYGSPICYGYDSTRIDTTSQLVINYKRVEIDFGTTVPTETANAFQLLIPVKTVVNVFKINVFLASLQQHPSNPKLGYYLPTVIYRMTGDNNLLNTGQMLDFTSGYSSNTVALSSSYVSTGITNTNYAFDLTQNIIGSTKSLMKISAYHSENPVIIKTNEGIPSTPNNGAGFTMNLAWNFYTPSTSFNWPYSGVNYAEKCLYYKYNKDTSTSDFRYGVYCPLQTGAVDSQAVLNISYFYITSTSGVTIPSQSCFGYSKNTGNLASLIMETGVFSSGLITTPTFVLIPFVIPLYTKSNLLKWKFSTQNPLVDGMKIIITFNSSVLFSIGSSCYIVHSDPNLQKSLTCTASSGSGYSIQFVISGCSTCPMQAGSFTIMHYGNDAPTSLSAGSYQNNLITLITTVLSTNVLVDSSLALSNFNVIYDGTPTKISNFTASSLNTLSTYNLNATTNISFTFGPNNRGIFAFETVVIDLGWFAAKNLNNPSLICSIRDPSNPQTFDNRWYSLSISSLSTIKLVTKQDITSSDQNPRFLFFCSNLYIPETISSDLTISISLKDNGLTTTIQDIQKINMTTPLSNNYLLSIENFALIKPINVYISPIDIYFNVSLNISLLKNSSIFITFPTYYLPYLTYATDPITCQLNNLNISCSLFTDRTLLLSSFATDLPLGSPFLIRINGPYLPKTAITAQSFYIAFNNISTNLTNMMKYGYILDILPQQTSTIQNLIVMNFSMDSIFIRALSNYNISLLLNPSQVQPNNIIILNFPYEWNYALNHQMANCSLFSSLDPPNLLSNCTGFGNQILAYIGLNASTSQSNDPLTLYTLYLSGIYNPDTVYCKPNKISLSLYNDVSKTLIYNSGYNTLNIPEIYQFGLNPLITYLDFSSIASDGSNDMTSHSIEILPGVYSKLITISPYNTNTNGLLYPLYIQIKTAGFYTNPKDLYIYPGQPNVSFTLASDLSVLPGSYAVHFNKIADPYSKYGELPLLSLLLKAELYKIPILNGYTYDIPGVFGGITLPISIDISDKPPYTAFNLFAYIEDPTMNITFYDGTLNKTFTFTSSETTQAFILKLNYLNNLMLYPQTRVLFNILGNTNNSYSAPDPITVYITQDLTESPNFLLYTASVSTGSTYVDILMNCDQNGVIYYGISNLASQTDDLLTIKTNALAFTPYNIDDINEKQYGLILINDTNSGYNITLSVGGLRSNTSYIVLGYCVNMGDEMSISIMNSFTTIWNGGYVQKLNFGFDSLLGIGMVESLICFLDVYFGVNTDK